MKQGWWERREHDAERERPNARAVGDAGVRPFGIAAAGLRASEERYRELYDDTPVMLQSIDDAGRLLSVNRHWLDVMGYELGEVLGRAVTDFLTPESAERARSYGIPMVRATGGIRNIELQFVTRAGEIVDVLLSSRARIRNGRIDWSLAFAVDVTEKKRAAEALQRSEDHLRRLFEALADGLFLIGDDGTLLDANEQACVQLGRTRDEVIGRKAWDFSTTPPAKIREVIATATASRSNSLETVHVRKDGTTFPVEVHVAVFEEAPRRVLAALVRDISVRTRAERALRESEARFAGIFHSAMDAIILFDGAMVVELFNKSAETTFRCGAADAIGRPLHRFLSPELRQKLEEFVPCLADGEGSPHLLLPAARFQAVRCDGERFPVEATLSAVRLAGQDLYCIILRDVKELERAEAAVDTLMEAKAYLEEELGTNVRVGDIVGSSPALRQVLRQVERVAATDTTVLITGETGTGKELIATAIHRASGRADRLLVKVNCAALPAGLIESELFGHERGAFTGAVARKIGRFELADRGTLFLDEIGDLPAEFQAKLLRVLQEGEFERVGGSRTLRADVRLIAATNRDLSAAVGDGRFRADLFYRLNVFPIHMPPLRERRNDIPHLAAHLVQKHARRMGRRIERIHPDTLEALVAYDWPGNVRELQNVIERALVLADGPVLLIADRLRPATPAPTSPAELSLDDAQRDHIRSALERTGWRVSGPNGAARILGIKPSTLETRMKKLGIERPAHHRDFPGMP